MESRRGRKPAAALFWWLLRAAKIIADRPQIIVARFDGFVGVGRASRLAHLALLAVTAPAAVTAEVLEA